MSNAPPLPAPPGTREHNEAEYAWRRAIGDGLRPFGLEKVMTKTIRALYREGKLEPMEPLDIEDRTEVTVTVTCPEPSSVAVDPVTATSGAWRDLFDCEQFEKDVGDGRINSSAR